MNDTDLTGSISRAADGTYDLTSSEPKAVVRIRFLADNPNGAGPRYRCTEYLHAANKPSSELIDMLADMGHFTVQIVDVVLVCESCQYPFDGMTHPAC